MVSTRVGKDMISHSNSSVRSTERVRISPRSHVLQYEVQLKELFEKYPTQPSRERASGCFAILSEIIPFLGTLGPIVRLIKDELYSSVYSEDLTSSSEEPFVERLPYFSAVNRICEARTTEGVKTTETLTELQQKLKFREYDLQILQRKNLALKQEISDREASERKLREEISGLEEVIRKQEGEKGSLKTVHTKAEEGLKRVIEDLQTSLAQSNHIIEKLTVFKSAYDEPTEEGTYEEEKDKSKQQLVIDSQGMVEYDIYQAERLEEQFADILNWQLDDYESALAQLRKKREILAGVTTNEEEREESYRIELNDIVNGFKKRVADLLEEQQLLKKHIQALKIVLANYAGDKLMAAVQRTADEALRKYAFALHYSEDDGQTFYPCKTMQYCNKCGDRTVVCPHRTLYSETVRIPLGITHLKFTHPSLRLRTNFNRLTFEANLANRLVEPSEETWVTEDESMEVSKSFKKIWQGFYESRGGTRPRISRPIPLNKLLGFIQEIYDTRWAFEEDIEKDLQRDRALTKFVDFFYELMENRYQIKEIARKAIHDIFTALQHNEETSSAVAIFVRHLSEEEDAMWKYITLARKLFATYEVLDAAAYRKIIQIIYPSRTKEIYDQMELEFVAFSKNRFSKEMVEEHLMHMLRTNIEPNQKFFFRTLKRFDYQEQGFLSYDDFDEALGQILPGAPTRMKRMRYRLSELDVGKDIVPLERLALIGSYISLYCCYLSHWVPQALVATDFMNDAYFSSPGTAGEMGGPRSGRETSTLGDSPEANAGMQEEIEDILHGHVENDVLDEQAIEEEAMRMAKRVAIMQRMEKDTGDDEEDEDQLSDLPSMRLSMAYP
ncbi:uncharacterized protein SPPG_04506 [Spizellomyces punctatus DAOM BR117]|uniref:Uncharacterized protein n=1 Tax=Spizellomyces punctatus (strain DAOM BR117) TaxID=645134 RepID=A0A0L0HH11_SPIPD|nr:uncharacterized protein SPPG_04506 [Spizellomyces punctatus DAOM BR117]KND00165.1 hypothetical protein SPPG_04506 [Spizellomyces punctatus DAOM BR117]|eukprot:XP_016608204.1 hypothetical protein SPPG_04506 [Spizellomyces punctatus DAOM BR117]